MPLLVRSIEYFSGIFIGCQTMLCRDIGWCIGDRFGQPDTDIALTQGETWLDTWWWDEAKAERVEVGMQQLGSD